MIVMKEYKALALLDTCLLYYSSWGAFGNVQQNDRACTRWPPVWMAVILGHNLG